MKLALHISPCPNDTFMFEALLSGRVDTEGLHFELNFADIEELNARAMRHEANIGTSSDTRTDGHDGVCDETCAKTREGMRDEMHEGMRVDVCKVSWAVVPAIATRYAILQSGGAMGRGNGPLLVYRPEVETIRKIAVPGLHTTANLLIDRLLPHLTDRTPVLFSRIADSVANGEFDAGVLIHEGRFTYHEKDLKLAADLGLEWERATGLPLPLGAIAVSRDMPREVALKVDRVLRRSIEHALANPSDSRDFVRRNAREMAPEVIDSHIAMFVNAFSIDPGEEGARAAELLTGIPAEKIFL